LIFSIDKKVSNSRIVFVITGANGLVGCHLISALLLAQKKDICCLLRSEQSKNQLLKDVSHISGLTIEEVEASLQFKFGNILDIVFLEEVFIPNSIVIHAAACVSFDPKDRELLIETNINGTKNVVNACLANNVNKLCYVSSVAAIGRMEGGLYITEDTPWIESSLNSAYAISKRYAELEVWRGGEEGLPIVIINPTVILGYTSLGNSSSSIFHTIKKGFPFTSKGFNGFVGASDVAKVLLLLIDKNIINERFIVSSENMQYDVLFSQIAKSLKKKGKFIIVKDWMKWITLPLAWLISKLTNKPPFITPEVFSTSMATKLYSSYKLTNSTGFQYTPVHKVVDEVGGLMS
jgi:dihydroflavonol-4-reductase